jgi:hypothetical protein
MGVGTSSDKIIESWPIKAPDIEKLRKNLNLYTECGLDSVYSYGLLVPNLWFFDSVFLYGANYDDLKNYLKPENYKLLIDNDAIYLTAREHTCENLKNSQFYKDFISKGKYIEITQSDSQGEHTKSQIEQPLGITLRNYFNDNYSKDIHPFEHFNPESKTWKDTKEYSKEWTYCFFSNVDVKLSLLNDGISALESVPPYHRKFWSKGYNVLEEKIDERLFSVVKGSELAQREFELLNQLRDWKFENLYRLTKHTPGKSLTREEIKTYGTAFRDKDIKDFLKHRADIQGLRDDFKSRLYDLQNSKSASEFLDRIEVLDELINDFEKEKKAS